MPNVQGKSILIFGDSLSAGYDTPGGQLAHQLRARGAVVSVNALSGRSAYNYFAREGGEATLALLAEQAPNIVIVMLGTNDVGLDVQTDEMYMERIRKAFADVGADVWAIGPPGAEHTEQVIAMERRVFGASKFIDARELSEGVPRSPDGVHFTPAGGAELGLRLADAFVSAGGGWGLLLLLVGAAGIAYWFS